MIVKDVIDTVCQQSAVTKSLLLSKDRRKFIVDARQIIIFALTQLGFTQQFIAEQLNYKDHTTVHHHLRRDCPISHENRRRATQVVRQCNYMASIKISRQKPNVEEFLEKVQQIR
jgi:chromosomal replication initiation ATPase DnaA